MCLGYSEDVMVVLTENAKMIMKQCFLHKQMTLDTQSMAELTRMTGTHHTHLNTVGGVVCANITFLKYILCHFSPT